MNLWSRSDMWIYKYNNRWKIKVIWFGSCIFQILYNEGFFVCPPVAIYQKKKYTLKNIDSTSVEAFTTLGRIQMEIEDIYICKSKASVHILVYLGILTIINILVWDKAELGAFLVNWSCLIQNHSWMHEMSIKKDEAMTEMTCDLLYQNIRYSTSAYFM